MKINFQCVRGIITLVKRIAGLWTCSCHPILLVDRGLAAIELFHAWDHAGRVWIIRGKAATEAEIRPGMWVPLAIPAKRCPVWQNLLSVRYGQSYGDQAYRCRIVIWADTGYPDPGYWVVSTG